MAASHDTAAGHLLAVRELDPALYDASQTPEGRARAATALKLQRIGQQISELLRAKYEVACAQLQTNDRAARDSLRRREVELEAQIIYLADHRSKS